MALETPPPLNGKSHEKNPCFLEPLPYVQYDGFIVVLSYLFME